jgi:hypothetical protein
MHLFARTHGTHTHMPASLRAAQDLDDAAPNPTEADMWDRPVSRKERSGKEAASPSRPKEQ